ncbi:isoleucine--tRNA ligase [Caminibacter mediatlanticus]|uniref:Isoleucine--tRNA ligase n=1 Tax=Caminibacter mediatlanticus TB-2 TaxID=391592 RepID=A0AAI9AG96_9BACT|nr:isoleucine--tRNA ligase [Caminibacter mediatlanticus]EDM23083.1 isoleucyl-tRNA synthetase [Caminibacter mediatlanticus TB-2]
MDYKDTLLLPKTSFPMRGNLPQNEPKRYKKWFSENVYDRMKQNRKGNDRFNLHDGPPYANGHIHIGHALNKILKDIINKYYYFQGFDIRYVPGWDCHGLPIEQQVEKKLGKEKKESLPKTKIRELCREHASKFIEIQKEEFKSLGVIGDWENPYKTMDFEFEADIYKALSEIAKKGLLVERSKPVFWCMHDKTALAEAEVEYENKEDYSIYVAFPLSEDANKKLNINNAKIIIWTTTPWTLPANMGIALNPEEAYVLTSDNYIVAKKRYEALKEEGVIKGDILKEFSAAEFENLKAINPLNNRESLIILGEHVTMDGGSGCVHTAPGHGEEDYRVWLKYGNSEIIQPVDDEGKYSEIIKKENLLPDEFVGEHIFKANEKILELLGDNLVSVSKFTHSYPHCWRCHNPVIFRATKQFFIAMDKEVEGDTLRNRALNEIEKVEFTPESGKNRLKSMVSNRPDWCISRQRDWGVPIAFFRDKTTGELIIDDEIIENIYNIFKKEGADAWYDRSIEKLLPESKKHLAKNLEKVEDILDVWFDSGSTWFAVLKSNRYDAGEYPASMYLEGSDQHRGWFQSSLLVSTAIEKKAPYKSILTHGFTVDEKGEKMSKSKGNVVAPSEVARKFGTEILRLWVATSDYSSDIKLGENILKQVAEQYRKIRNTIRFLLANINDLEEIKLDNPSMIDKWILARSKEVFDEVVYLFGKYDFSKAFQILNNFIVTELSAIYLDVCKDRLYCEELNSTKRRNSQSTMAIILKELLALLAPVLTYTMDEAVENAPRVIKEDKKDIFDFVYTPIMAIENPIDDEVLDIRRRFYEIVDRLKKEKVIKDTLELAIETNYDKLLKDEMAEFFNVSLIGDDIEGEVLDEFHIGENQFVLKIKKSPLHKCPRCWRFLAKEENSLCDRCSKVLNG